jgi:hypothetical protein
MRLTLRTLLSYRDGVLPTKAHEELGLKFRESQTAQNLASRIDHAQANPKALAIELGEIEQTCAPNEVSEFLDGAMSLDRVYAMERKCISSSAMLAELACVHSVLARELLGTSRNPATQPSPALLARLHALHDPNDRVASDKAASGKPASGAPPARSSMATVDSGDPEAFGVDLEDNPLDPNSSPNDSSANNASGLILQTVLLAIALAIVAWWILRDTSVLPTIQLRLPSNG